jgi:DNA adenine methylase
MKPETHIIPFRPAFSYPGGKSKLLRHILPRIPAHDIYVEPFCGAAAVLLAKPPCRLEVINDVDQGLVALMRYAAHHREALLSELARWSWGNSRANFHALRANPGVTELQRAAHWFLLRVSSFGGQGETYGRSRDRPHGYDPARPNALIKGLSERLRRVEIECGDWEGVVSFHDSPETFFFFDPPYLGCSDVGYGAFSAGDLRRLRDRLAPLKGRWMLTINDSAETREIFAQWPCHQMKIRYGMASKHGPQVLSGELLFLHPDIAAQEATDCGSRRRT